MLSLEHPDASTKGWIIRFVRNNHWRVALWMDFEDLVQDAHLYYIICVRRYPSVTDRPHIMAIFKRAFANHVTDLANYRTRQNELLVSQITPPSITAEELLSNLAGAVYGDASLATLITEAPTEIKVVLDLLVKDVTDAFVRQPYKRQGKRRETTNQRIRRLLRHSNLTCDYVGMLQGYFSSAAAA